MSIVFASHGPQLHILSDQCQKRAKAAVLDHLKVPTCESPLQTELEVHVPGPKYSGSVINRDLNRGTANLCKQKLRNLIFGILRERCGVL